MDDESGARSVGGALAVNDHFQEQTGARSQPGRASVWEAREGKDQSAQRVSGRGAARSSSRMMH